MSQEPKIENARDGGLINLELKNEAGVFSIKEAQNGHITVEVENTQGKKFTLNDLLPKDWRILSYISPGGSTELRVDYLLKEVVISPAEPHREGWKHLLSILHEIGHAVVYESDEAQKNLYLNKARLLEEIIVFPDDTELIKKVESAMSKIERDAWAWAIREFKKILEELNIDQKNIFESNTELREYINNFLMDYKGWGIKDIKNMQISEQERQELLEHISSLYTKTDKTK